MQSDLFETTASGRALAKVASDALQTPGFSHLTVCIAIGNFIFGEKISFRIIAVYFFLIAIFWETNGEDLCNDHVVIVQIHGHLKPIRLTYNRKYDFIIFNQLKNT